MENSFTYSPGEVAKVRLVQFSILSPDEIEDDKFKLALKIRNPKSRLEQILCACKTKNKCEGDDEIDVLSLLGHDGEEPLRKRKSGCGALQPTLTIDGMNMIAEYKAQRKNNDDQGQLPEPVEGKQTLTAERVLEVLARITDEDCQLLGLNPQYTRPDWMILQVLPIPPPSVRTSVAIGTSFRSEVSSCFITLFPFMLDFHLNHLKLSIETFCLFYDGITKY
ncbi:hypothetical protein KPL70_014946 [Citrus sinensis]|nr:hypothetical protein KPL70_014946 [Citrus sinensis]